MKNRVIIEYPRFVSTKIREYLRNKQANIIGNDLRNKQASIIDNECAEFIMHTLHEVFTFLQNLVIT